MKQEELFAAEAETLRIQLQSGRREPEPPIIDFHELFHSQVSSNVAQFAAFRPRLVTYLGKVIKTRRERLKEHSERFNAAYKEWQLQVSTSERGAADAELLRQQPNTVHITSAMAQSGESSPSFPADYDQFRWMRTLAAIPDMITTDSKCIFNSSYRVENSRIISSSEGSAFLHAPSIQVWTEAEQRVFVQKYLVHAKAFHRIASFLPFKSTADCIRFYYANKSRLQLKQLMTNYRRGIPLDLDAVLNK